MSHRFDHVNRGANEMRADTNRRFEEVNAGLIRRIEELRADMNRRFEEVNVRLGRIETRLDNHEDRPVRLEEPTSPVRR